MKFGWILLRRTVNYKSLLEQGQDREATQARVQLKVRVPPIAPMPDRQKILPRFHEYHRWQSVDRSSTADKRDVALTLQIPPMGIGGLFKSCLPVGTNRGWT